MAQLVAFDGLEAVDDVVDGGAPVHHVQGQARGADSAGGGWWCGQECPAGLLLRQSGSFPVSSSDRGMLHSHLPSLPLY